MGIYSNSTLYGISIYRIIDDEIHTLFTNKYDVIMNYEQMKEAYLFYEHLFDKNNIYFKIYTECSSTLDINNKDKFMMWHPISLNTFLEKFNI